MFKTYSVKIQNSEYFRRLFLEAKWLYNYTLETGPYSIDTKINQVDIKTPENTESRDLICLSSQMKQQIVKRIKNSIKGLSSKKKNGQKVGHLKFVKYIKSIPLTNQTFKISKNRVKFQCNKKLFKTRGMHQIESDDDIRSAILVQKPSGIYLNITVKRYEEQIKKDKYIGVDFGIKDHLTFHDGTKINFNQDLTRLKQLQKRLSRKKKGSNNYIRCKKLLQKEYEKLANQKKDASNKIINKLKQYFVCFQDEMINNWHKDGFGKQVQHSILGRVKSALYLNPDNLVIEKSVPTTKLCPKCGSLNEIPLSSRHYKCSCGYNRDRDIHSANNMILCGSGRATVEKELDLFNILYGIDNKHLSMKQEAMSL